MTRISTILIVLAALTLSVVAGTVARVIDPPPPALPASIASVVESIPKSCDIQAQITQSRKLLASVSLRVGKKEISYTEVRGDSKQQFKDPERQIVLVLLNLDTCSTQRVLITKHGDQLIAPTGFVIEPITRLSGIRWNSYNTLYQVTQPAGWFVIANLYPSVSGTGAKRTITNVFYVSTSPELIQEEFVQAGKAYRLALARSAQEKLRALKVPSRALPGTLLADTIVAQPQWLAKLPAIELTDPGEVAADPHGAFQQVDARIGLNGDNVAPFTRSSASAVGLLQFTDNGKRLTAKEVLPGTYTRLRLAYPAANLITDFTTGARDPLNAMMAAYLHYDDGLAQLIAALGPDVVNDPALEEKEAGIYNGGALHVIEASRAQIKTHLTDWTDALPICKGSHRTGCLPSETKVYVAVKLRSFNADRLTDQPAQADRAPNQ